MKIKFALVAAVQLVGLHGCQSYERRPLRLGDYVDEWGERSLDLDSIRHYAASLSDGATMASSFDPGDGLSLFEGEAVALHFNPQLRLARAAAGVPLASARESGWWPDPQFQAEILRFVDRGKKTSFKLDGASVTGVNSGGIEATPAGFRRVEGDYIDDPWILGAGLNFTIPVSGRLAVETDLRWSEYDAAWRRILVQEWSLVTALRGKWLDWSASAEKLRITREYATQLETIANMTRQLVEAGEMKPTEGRLIQIELARWQAAGIDFERDETLARLELLATMGLSPKSTVRLNPTALMPDEALHVVGAAAQLLANHPRVKAVEADYERAEQQLRLEISRQNPDLDVGPNYSFEEGFTRWGLGLGFPIPLWNHNRQAVAEAFAEREAARVQAEVVVEETLAELARVEQRLTFARQRRYALLDRVVPLADRQVEDSRTLLSLGEVDVVLLREALERSLHTKLELIDAAVSEGRAANDMQQMLTPRWFTPSQNDAGEDRS